RRYGGLVQHVYINEFVDISVIASTLSLAARGPKQPLKIQKTIKPCYIVRVSQPQKTMAYSSKVTNLTPPMGF
ncbi:MAG: hypothetical protein KDD28_00015, partial [Phaeodactylibacter sp.]|nr:hypothetical protein [Phaeodactylibacter sp.]